MGDIRGDLSLPELELQARVAPNRLLIGQLVAVDVTLELAAIELERGMARWDSALRRIDKMMQLSSRKETWLVRRAEILGQAGRYSEAGRAFAQALDAIYALPERNRMAAATIQLETHIRKQLRLHSAHHEEDATHAKHK